MIIGLTMVFYEYDWAYDTLHAEFNVHVECFVGTIIAHDMWTNMQTDMK